MKKIIALVLVLALALAFAACGQKKEASLVILDDSLAPEEYGIAFSKDNADLCYAVEAALVELKNNGKMAEIYTKWFGEDKSIFESDADVANVDKAALPNPLKLGLDDAFPPMGYRDDKNNIIGFDIDLAKAVCDYYGIELECIPIDWDNKDMELQTGEIDCIWNGLTITDDRLESYAMSAPYLANRQVVVVADNSGIKTLEDLSGKKVALQSGSSADEALKANKKVNSSIAEKVELKDNIAALMELKGGSVDAVIMDEVVARYTINNEL